MRLASRIRPALLIGVIAITWSSVSAAYRPSAADCAAEADRAARDSGTMLGGAARGAARGAIFGAIVGDSGKATRRGAALGAFTGGVRNQARKNDVYTRVYDDCMRRY